MVCDPERTGEEAMGSGRTYAGVRKAYREGEVDGMQRAVSEMGKGSSASEASCARKGRVRSLKRLQYTHLKRRSETEADEPKAKKGSVASTKEQPKAVELKPALEVSKANSDEGAKVAAKAEAYASSHVCRITDLAGKRRRKSKSRLAKKAARTRRRRHSPVQSVPPREEADEEEEEEEEENEIDVNVFESLRGVIPETDAQDLLVEMAEVAKGYKPQSESAKTSAPRMESLMLQMGQEHMAMKKRADEERRRENQMLTKALGLVRNSQASGGQPARGSAEGASGSRGDDPEVRSRPG